MRKLIRTISGGAGDDGGEGAEEKTPEELAAETEAAKNAQPKPVTMEELNEHLQNRDNALIQTFQQGMTEIVQSIMQQQGGKRDAEPSREEAEEAAREAQETLNISPEEFWRNPAAAMQKFYEVKVAPLKQAMQKPKTGNQPDAGLQALAETRIQGLWNKLSDDDKKRYGPFLTKVIEQTDMRVLADAKGIDSVWRLTKSHADEFLENQERQRTERNQRANMPGGGGSPKEVTPKTELTKEQAEIAEAFGISPELYAKNSSAYEVEPGGNRKKKEGAAR